MQLVAVLCLQRLLSQKNLSTAFWVIQSNFFVAHFGLKALNWQLVFIVLKERGIQKLRKVKMR
ncbi:MAG: hypothetical protein RL235_318 [Chlamydiota bacterium]|jgi:hypothetical protein